MKKYMILATILTASCNIFAQKDTLNAVIQVENEYNPVVVKANKQSFTPQIEISTQETPLDLIFSQGVMPYERFISERNVKEVLPKQETLLPGYARFGYGNNNNTDMLASYKIRLNERDNIDAIASFDGYSTELEGIYGDWDSRFYNTLVAANYTHHFDNLLMGVKATFNNKVFNYQNSPLFNGTDKQNSGRYKIEMNAISNYAGPLSYNANIAYAINTRKYAAGTEERITENHLTAKGTIAYELPNTDIQSMGANLQIDGFIYNSALKPEQNEYNNYTSIRFNPFMNFKFNDWKIRIGVHTDILTDNGTFFAFAPDCSIEGAISDKTKLTVMATGGRTPNTFSTLEELSPYWCYTPGDKQYTATYKVFDVSAGLGFTFEPVLINLYTGYSYTKDDLMPCILEDNIVYTSFAQSNSYDLYVGGRIDYDYGGWIRITADIRYDKWGCKDSDNLLMYKPELTAGIKGEARLYDNLYATIGYTFTGYTKGDEARVEEMNALDAKLSYKFHKQIGAFIKGNNLLNSEHEIYPGYIVQGTNFLAGVSVNF